MPWLIAGIVMLCLISSAQAQNQHLYLVLYEVGSTSPKALVPSKLDRAGCERQAAAYSEKWAANKDDPFRAKCEFRGPNDMIWKLHPELVK